MGTHEEPPNVPCGRRVFSKNMRLISSSCRRFVSGSSTCARREGTCFALRCLTATRDSATRPAYKPESFCTAESFMAEQQALNVSAPGGPRGVAPEYD